MTTVKRVGRTWILSPSERWHMRYNNVCGGRCVPSFDASTGRLTLTCSKCRDFWECLYPQYLDWRACKSCGFVRRVKVRVEGPTEESCERECAACQCSARAMTHLHQYTRLTAKAKKMHAEQQARKARR